MRLRILLFFVVLSGALQAQEQSWPFYDEILEFKKQDSVSPPPAQAILFVGSSSFRMWRDVQDYFPEHTIINRGFGGSSLPDVIRYEQDILFPYHPKQIVIYCGENDIASSATVTAGTVITRFKQLFHNIRARFPGIPILFISIKPSPSRWPMRERMIQANDGIREFLLTQKYAGFIDVWKKMLGKDGQPMADIYIDDKLHMNAKGYAIWQQQIESHLLK